MESTSTSTSTSSRLQEEALGLDLETAHRGQEGRADPRWSVPTACTH